MTHIPSVACSARCYHFLSSAAISYLCVASYHAISTSCYAILYGPALLCNAFSGRSLYGHAVRCLILRCTVVYQMRMDSLLISHYLNLSCVAVICLVLVCLVLCWLGLPCRALCCLILSCLVVCRVMPCLRACRNLLHVPCYINAVT